MAYHITKKTTEILAKYPFFSVRKMSCPCPYCRTVKNDPYEMRIPRLPAVDTCPDCGLTLGYGEEHKIPVCISCRGAYKIPASGDDFNHTSASPEVHNAMAMDLPPEHGFSYWTSIAMFSKCPRCNDFQWIRIVGLEESSFRKFCYRIFDKFFG